MRSKKIKIWAVAALLLSSLAPTAAQMKMTGNPAAGLRLFFSAALGANGLSCAHCHANYDEKRRPDGRIRPGHSLYNAAGRETWWGADPEGFDAYPNIGAAAVVCVERFMRSPEKLTAQQMLDLDAYLSSLTPRPDLDPLVVHAAADKTGQYGGFENGDKERGRTLFYAACHTCHPNGNAGIAPAIPRAKAPAFYARKVREGDGLGAVLSGVDPNAYDPSAGLFMPFFGADRLDDGQLRDIIAYLLTLPPSAD